MAVGFTNAADLDGSWSCTTYGSLPVIDTCSAFPESTLLYKKLGIMTFTASSKTWLYTGAGSPQGCGVNSYVNGAYEVQSNRLILQGERSGAPGIFDTDIYPLAKKTPTSFAWTGANSNIIECTKTNTAPSPANNLTGVVSGTTVALTWEDKSNDESGFKVQRRISTSSLWVTVNTTPADIINYSDSVSAGSHFYRVLATNSFGDSISSNVIEVTVK